ncbi:hypothetical protein EPO17_01200 [Patescibacteria group bacterium]|nr:MAG: hypothetical protein EPO17_01200 [Patescibacteria group bacterium]
MNESTAVLNVSSASRDWRAHLLSNLVCAPFELNGQVLASVEGFIQGIKYPKGDPRREQCFKSWGEWGKKMGEGAERKFVWWNGKEIPYGTPEHHELISKAICAKFYCNYGALVALRATEGLVLTHNVGPESAQTSLPANVFCKILTDLRAIYTRKAKT